MISRFSKVVIFGCFSVLANIDPRTISTRDIIVLCEVQITLSDASWRFCSENYDNHIDQEYDNLRQGQQFIACK